MARPRRSFIVIDTQDILRQADAFGRLGAERLGQAGMRAINEVLPRTEQKAREAIVAGINLPEPYLRERMGIRSADNPTRPEGVIFARWRHAPLGRFSPQQLTAPVKHPDRAKGDRSRGIAKGQKAAGVSVEVRRGGRKAITNGFLMPLKNGNGIGVFTRDRGALRFQHRLGPSVYQLFRVQADLLAEETSIDLQLAVLAEAEREIEGVFA